MNILYIDHYAGSPDMGMEFRPYYLAREWVKMGHQVTMLAGDYSHLRRKNPNVSHDFQLEDIEGIAYCWVKTGAYEGNGGKRAMTMLRFVKKLYANASKIAYQFKPDVVIASSTYPIDTFAAQRIAKKAGAKLIHEVHDMWPATLYEIGGMSKRHPFVVMMQIGENSAYKHSDYVVSLLPSAKGYMMQHKMAAHKFVHIPNGIVLDDWLYPKDLPSDLKLYLEQKRQDRKFIVGYCGGHALSNALGCLLEAAEKINNENIEFVLVGGGAEKANLVRFANEKELHNVHFFDPIDKRAIPMLLEYFDCGFISALDSPLYRFGICPNKLFDYMFAALPVVFAIPVPESPVSKAGCGICVESEDARGIMDAINALYNMNPEDLETMGARGKETVLQEYEYKKLACKFEKLFV